MKKLFAFLLVIGMSSTSFAMTPLSDLQMDSVTAGTHTPEIWGPANIATIVQVSASPVTVSQANVLTAEGATNYASIVSGNFADILLRVQATAP